MKKRAILITALLLACITGYIGLTFSARNAGDINSYDIKNVTSIEIQDIETSATIKIDEKDKIGDIIKTFRNDYKVRRMPKIREKDIFEKNRIKYCVTVYSKDDTAIVDQYFLTSFETVVVIDIETMNGLKRTRTYESAIMQTEIYKAIEDTMKGYE